MQVVIDIDENVFTRLFDNGTDFYDTDDILAMAKSIRKCVPISKFLEELKRKILMEVDGGTDDRYLSYIDICDRISNSINEYKTESEEQIVPHSLRAKIKSLRYKGIIADKDCDRLCKALDNEGVLDKIRAEIEALNPVDYVHISSYEGHKGAGDIKDDILLIIDKYKKESEDKK